MVLPVIPVDVLDTTIVFTTGVVLSALNDVPTVGVVSACMGLVIVAFFIVTRVAAVSTTLFLTFHYVTSQTERVDVATYKYSTSQSERVILNFY